MNTHQMEKDNILAIKKKFHLLDDESRNRFSLDLIIEEALRTAQTSLRNFATSSEFLSEMHLVFGDRFDTALALDLAENWARGDFSQIPEIEILSAAELNGANGAFAQATNKIYLSREYIEQNASNISAIANLWLEEYGHFVDARINEVDAVGDEGVLFAAVVTGEALSEGQVERIRREDDSETIMVDAQDISVEQSQDNNFLISIGENRAWFKSRLQNKRALAT